MDCAGLFSIAAFILTVCVMCYRRRKQNQMIITKMGLKGPEPHWLLGSLRDILSAKLYTKDLLQMWTRQYGKTFGYYEGGNAVVVTADVDIIREILVKKYQSFDCHKFLPLQPDADDIEAPLLALRGQKWKRIRTICNPSFSTGKIKWMMSGAVSDKLDTLVSVFRDTGGENVDVTKIFQGLTLDIMLNIAFGIEVDALKQPDSPLLVKTRAVFDAISSSPHGMMHVLSTFPILSKCMMGFGKFVYRTGLSKLLPPSPMAATEEIGRILCDIIDLRQNSGEKRLDLTQSLIDAEIKDNTDDIIGDKKLSKVEIMSNSILFLLAGYESTSSTLGIAAYLLATNPDKQTKVQEEIDQVTQGTHGISYEILSEMEYLNMVICETLRLYPFGGIIENRTCVEETVINGLKFPKGVSIQINVESVHRDPDVWGPEDPSMFVPERFTSERKKERHPMAWLAFGAGPRSCIGQRFATIEIKMALARILKEFTFVQCEKTEEKLELHDALVATKPTNGIVLKVQPR